MEPFVSLDLLLEQNNDAINALEHALTTNGWCFLTLNQPISSIDDCVLQSQSFFSSLEEYKFNFFYGNNFGYKYKDSVQVFRVLTGATCKELVLPLHFVDTLPLVCSFMDDTAKKIVSINTHTCA
jgi:hypothetical protein